MLTEKYLDSIPPGSRAERADGFLRAEQVEAQRDRIRALAEIACGRDQALHHLALQWVLARDGITSAIIGTRTVAQLDDNLAALDAPPLDPATLAAIDAIAPPAGRKEAEG
jgi:L-glyceraldehyde 3-phosphate reductase